MGRYLPPKTESFFQDGTYGEVWRNPKHKDGICGCIVHGLGEHSGRYDECIAYLLRQPRFSSIIVWDLWGHGRTKGTRGDATGGLEGLIRQSGLILSGHPEVDWIWGHSLGALVVLGVLETRRFVPTALKSVILSSPPFVLGREPNVVQKMVLPVAKSMLPSVTLRTGIEASQISAVVEEQRKYAQDPLIHDRVSVRMYQSILESGRLYSDRIVGILKRMSEIRMMVVHGGADTIALPRSLEVVKGYGEKEGVAERLMTKRYDASRHEIHHDKDWRVFLDNISVWLAEKETV